MSRVIMLPVTEVELATIVSGLNKLTYEEANPLMQGISAVCTVEAQDKLLTALEYNDVNNNIYKMQPKEPIEPKRSKPEPKQAPKENDKDNN